MVADWRAGEIAFTFFLARFVAKVAFTLQTLHQQTVPRKFNFLLTTGDGRCPCRSGARPGAIVRARPAHCRKGKRASAWVRRIQPSLDQSGVESIKARTLRSGPLRCKRDTLHVSALYVLYRHRKGLPQDVHATRCFLVHLCFGVPGPLFAA